MVFRFARRTKASLRVLIWLSILTLSAAAAGQSVLELPVAVQLDGTSFVGSAFLGSSFAVPGDLNGDGADDFVVSDLMPGLTFGPGTVRAISGSDFSTLYVIFGGTSLNQLVGRRLGAVGDVDLDGIPDFASLGLDTSFLPMDILDIRSGATGGLIHSVPAPGDLEDIVCVGDRNADGIPEIAIAPVQGGFAILDGATGVTLQLVPTPFLAFGYAIRTLDSIGDVNGDGIEDLVVVSRLQNPPTDFLEIMVSVPSGVGYLTAHAEVSYVGTLRASRAPDLDGDGLTDYFFNLSSSCGDPATHVLEARSSLTHGVLWSAPTPPGTGYLDGGRRNLVSLGDMDGDGVSDVAVVVTQVDVGGGNLGDRIQVHSGRDGAVIMVANVDPVPASFCNASPHGLGIIGFGTGDFDGDTLPDLLVPDSTATMGGYVRIYRNTTVFDPEAAAGNVVDPAGGGPRDVLRLGVADTGTATAGGPARSVFFPVGSDLGLWLESPQGTPGAFSAYALFGIVIPGANHETFPLPLGIGPMCFPPEVLDPFGGQPLFTLINTFGGAPGFLPAGAPPLIGQSSQVASTGAVSFPVTFWLQGFLTDLTKPWPFLSVTNAIRVVVR